MKNLVLALGALTIIALGVFFFVSQPGPSELGTIEEPAVVSSAVSQEAGPAPTEVVPAPTEEAHPGRAVITRPATVSPPEPRDEAARGGAEPTRAVNAGSPELALRPPPQAPRPTTTLPPEQPAVSEEERAQIAFRSSIRDAFREGHDAFVACYELVLELEPELSDQLIADVTVGQPADGEDYRQANLNGIEAGEMGLEHLDCFAEVIEGMRFPPAVRGGEYTLRYPLTLSAEE